MNDGEARLGYYGKVPSRGDFISRGLPALFVDAWDRWLQTAVSASRAQLGQDWVARYRVSPAWRFVVQPGLCGDHGAAGVLLPSIDKVGRHYPFTIAAMLPETLGAAGLAPDSEGWFNTLEVSGAAVLDQVLDPEGLADRLTTLGPLPVIEEVRRRVRSPLWSQLGREGALRAGLSHFGAMAESWSWIPPGCSQWWTSGSAVVEPSVLLCRGLPEPARFPAFWDGDWQRWHWQVAEPQAASPPRKGWRRLFGGAPASDGS